jgi:hypothetical protein
MRHLIAIALGTAAVLIAPERAAPAGLPCLGGVCLGAKLAEVAVNWKSPSAATLRERSDRIAKNRPQLEGPLKYARENFPGITDHSAEALLAVNAGDAYILDEASRPIFLSIPRYCKFVYVRGQAVSPSGNPMDITLVPTAAGEHLAVAAVRSFYDQSSQEENGRKLLSEANDRFGGIMNLGSGPRSSNSDFRAFYEDFDSRHFSIVIYDPKRFTFTGQIPFAAAMTEQLKALPECRSATRGRALD